MILNINHFGVIVRDMDRMVAFYKDAFGFEPVGYDIDSKGAFIRDAADK